MVKERYFFVFIFKLNALYIMNSFDDKAFQVTLV